MTARVSKCLVLASLLLSGVATLQAVVLDAQGSAYLFSSPTSGAPLTTPQPFQPTFQYNVCGSFDFMGIQQPSYCRHGLITKYSPDGKQLLAATYLGGNGDEFIADIQLDPTGNIVVTGYTTSTDFPMTQNAYRPKPASGFLTVLTADCSHLIYSTNLDFGAPSRLLIDSSGRPILIGQTQPPGFPWKKLGSSPAMLKRTKPS